MKNDSTLVMPYRLLYSDKELRNDALLRVYNGVSPVHALVEKYATLIVKGCNNHTHLEIEFSSP